MYFFCDIFQNTQFQKLETGISEAQSVNLNPLIFTKVEHLRQPFALRKLYTASQAWEDAGELWGAAKESANSFWIQFMFPFCSLFFRVRK